MATDRKAYMKEWNEKNKEKKAAKAKEWYQDNKEKILAQKKEYREKNREKILAKAKEKYQDNKDKVTAKQKEYSKTIKGRYSHYKGNAKQRGYEFSLTEDEFETFWQKPCHYCGDSINTIGLDRIDNNIGYSLDNLVSCCATCNVAKGTLSQEEYIERCRRVANNFTK